MVLVPNRVVRLVRTPRSASSAAGKYYTWVRASTAVTGALTRTILKTDRLPIISCASRRVVKKNVRRRF